VRSVVSDWGARAASGKQLDPVEVDTLVGHFINARMVALLSEQMVSRIVAGEQPGAEQSVIKMAWSEASQRFAESQFDFDGVDATSGPGVGKAGERYLSSRAATIAAGTSQVVRNILAERVLGLPRGVK
jgi:alkylation response protein AidB-like acyl-CoA dehydrogenase